MACLRRLLTLTATAAGTAALMLTTYPGGLAAAYRDARDFPSAQARLAANEVEREEIDARAAVVTGRIALKDALIADLIAGKTTLANVSARFAALNRDQPACMGVIRSRFPDVPDDERIALNVIEFVYLQEVDGTAHRPVLARLEGEYRQTFGRRAALTY